MLRRSGIIAGLLLLFSSAAQAAIITNSVTFVNITNLATPNEASLISADIIGDTADLTKALFVIKLADDGTTTNNPRITDVFFEDGALSGIIGLGDVDDSLSFAAFAEDTAVDFSFPSNQNNLPGANNASPAFVAGVDFSADPDVPGQNTKAINEGEYLGVLFGLDAGKTYNDLITEILAGGSRIGVHVQAIPGGSKSDSFVSLPPGGGGGGAGAVPEPISVVTWCGGLLCLALGRRFSRKSKKSNS
jgi:hypothetical protein